MRGWARPRTSAAATLVRAAGSVALAGMLVLATRGEATPTAPASLPAPAPQPVEVVVPRAVLVPATLPEPVVPAPAPPPAPPAAPTGPKRLMLIGDSMAFTAAEGLAPLAAPYGFSVANEGIFGCGLVRGGPYRYVGVGHQMDGRCEAWPALWQTALDRSRPDVVGILVGRWELMDRVHQGRWTNIFDPAFAAYVETEVDQALTLAGSTGARVVMFSTPLYRRGFAPGGGLWPEDDPARVEAVNALLRRVSDRRGVPMVDVGGWLSPDGRYTPEIGGIRVRSDGVHLTRGTGAVLAPWLFPQLQALTAA